MRFGASFATVECRTMASAFDEISKADGDFVRARFLAGALMKDITEARPGIEPKLIRKLRDEVFVPMVTNPEVAKALANGPLLNPSAMIRLPYAQQVLRSLKQKARAEALTDNDREVIRERHFGFEKATFSELAQIFGVHANTIKAICKTEPVAA